MAAIDRALHELNTMLRTAKLAALYPKAYFVSLLEPFFTPQREAYAPDFQEKEQRRKDKQPIGWAMGNKVIAGFKLENGEELSVEHFYFSRSLKPLTRAIDKLKADGIVFKGTVIEHGCGCGKFLHYFKDKLGMYAKGYDYYEPVVKIANIFKDVPVERKNTVTMDLEKCDLLFLSSYLPHVMHLDGFEQYVERMVVSAKQIIAMERYEPELDKILKKHGFIYRDYGFYIKT